MGITESCFASIYQLKAQNDWLASRLSEYAGCPRDNLLLSQAYDIISSYPCNLSDTGEHYCSVPFSECWKRLSADMVNLSSDASESA